MSEQIARAVWSRFVAERSTGDVVDGLVMKVLPFGALIEIDGVTGLLPRSTRLAQPESGSRIAVRVRTIDVTRQRFAAEAA